MQSAFKIPSIPDRLQDSYPPFVYWRMPDEINRYSLPSSVSIILLFCVPEIRFWNCAIVSLGIRRRHQAAAITAQFGEFLRPLRSVLRPMNNFPVYPGHYGHRGSNAGAGIRSIVRTCPILHSAPLAEVRSVVSIRTRFSSLIIT